MGSKKRKKGDTAGRQQKGATSARRQRDDAPEETVPGPSTSGRKVGRRRLWLFRVTAATVIPALLLLLLEVGLRLWGFGYPTAAIAECESNGHKAYRNNIGFAGRFFPPGLAREFEPFIFAADKPDLSFRVFVLGASAAQGVPEPLFGFGRILEALLSAKYPGARFEVITAAITAINSHVVLPIARDCAGYDPDLFIVYLGNNEVVGPYGPGTVLSPISSNLWAIRNRIALRGTRIGQLAEKASGLVASGARAPKRWGGLAMFLDKQVRSDSPAMEHVYTHFERNLQDICGVAQATGVRVIFCNVGSNLRDSPPFSSPSRHHP